TRWLLVVDGSDDFLDGAFAVPVCFQLTVTSVHIRSRELRRDVELINEFSTSVVQYFHVLFAHQWFCPRVAERSHEGRIIHRYKIKIHIFHLVIVFADVTGFVLAMATRGVK